MTYTVTISFAHDREYVFRIQDNADLQSRDEAQQWLDREWSDLDCTPNHPLGKVLTLDKLLSIAKNAGEKRFAEGGHWAEDYASSAIAVLGRDNVHVNVAEQIVG